MKLLKKMYNDPSFWVASAFVYILAAMVVEALDIHTLLTLWFCFLTLVSLSMALYKDTNGMGE